jgi:HAD superfamily 5'-nucleotidase-like hydrolase
LRLRPEGAGSGEASQEPPEDLIAVSQFDEFPRPLQKVLRGAGHDLSSPYTRRIFTNRDLDFDKVGVVGFDMDYTLARYRQSQLDAITIEATLNKLIGHGYPEQLRGCQANEDFAIRGLVVDTRLGNLLKMDRHGYVGRVYHGSEELSRAQRQRLYRNQRVGRERDRFAHVDTLFSLPEVVVYASIVTLLDERPELWKEGQRPSYARAFSDVRNAVDQTHQDDSIKKKIKADPERFLAVDPELAPTLHKLRSSGKRLFLLTNSYAPYSNAVMSFLLDGKLASYDSWQNYFDWMVVGSRKPDFFVNGAPFLEVSVDGEVLGETASPSRNVIYQGGNRDGMMEAMGVASDEVLYVGDHIYGDIVQSKKSSGWRTALVVDDLEHELSVRRDHHVGIREIETLSTLREQLAVEIGSERHLQRVLGQLDASALESEGVVGSDASKMLDTSLSSTRARFDRLRQHAAELDKTLDERHREVDAAFNPYWGSVFAERTDASMFGSQLEEYACVYTSRVSNFYYVSPARYFRAPHGAMPHWRRF